MLAYQKKEIVDEIIDIIKSKIDIEDIYNKEEIKNYVISNFSISDIFSDKQIEKYIKETWSKSHTQKIADETE